MFSSRIKKIVTAELFCGMGFLSAIFALQGSLLNVACEETEGNTLVTTSLMMLSLYLGQGIAPPVLGFCEETVGLRFGMLLCAVFMVLTSLIFVLKSGRGNRRNKKYRA